MTVSASRSEAERGEEAVALPEWLDTSPWSALLASRDRNAAHRAILSPDPGERELALMLSPAAGELLELMARRARAITRRRFGRTISLYTPLYLSNYCSGGCRYCGIAADRRARRAVLSREQLVRELEAIRRMGLEDVLLLTGERTPEADYDYLRAAVAEAARRLPVVGVEAFTMSEEEYRGLAEAGCIGVTVYQETYDPEVYRYMHRWGPKRDFARRLDAPERALRGGLRQVGIGALLGLAEPRREMLALYRHARHLLRTWWRAGVSISFPRIRPQLGGFQPDYPVDDRLLAQFIFALRIALPDVPLVLSTREPPRLRDGLAGIGISRMSVASRTTVGGYDGGESDSTAQFEVFDDRDVETFCAALRARGLDPVFKDWDAAYRGPLAPRGE